MGILSVDLQLPGSTSLKAKRKDLRRVKDGLVRGAGFSVAEVDHHDLWQRARLTLTVAARHARDAESRMDAMSRALHSDPSFVVLGETRELVGACGDGATVVWGSG